MAVIRFANIDAPINFSAFGLHTFTRTVNASASEWDFETAEDVFASASGAGFSFDENTIPVGGEISALALRFGSEAEPEIIASGLQLSAERIATGGRLLDLMLAGNDVINLSALNVGATGTEAASVIYGDAFEAGFSKRPSAITTGGNDVFITSNGAFYLMGDVGLVGDAEVGSAAVSGKTARYQGGVDVLTGVATFSQQTFVGDAFAVGAGGTLLGGDDQISMSSANPFSRLIGDAEFAAGRSSSRLARLNGGDDEIAAREGTSGMILTGDVDSLGNFGRVSGGNDQIDGEDGRDAIAGDVRIDSSTRGSIIRGGRDTIDGQLENDRIAGDVLELESNARPLRAGDGKGSGAQIIGGNDILFGGQGDDEIYGEVGSSEARALRKVSGGNDRIDGGEGNDKIFGQTGNDSITGGAGGDILSGGTGADRFIFLTVDDSRFPRGSQDLITDFSRKERDRIDLSAIDADLTRDGVQDFDFTGRSERTGPTGELSFRFDDGKTLLTADTDGDTLTDLFIELEGRVSFRESDFIF